MTTKDDFIRKASLFTNNGLIDPRVMPGYKEVNNESVNIVRKLRQLIELIQSKFERRLSANQ